MRKTRIHSIDFCSTKSKPAFKAFERLHVSMRLRSRAKVQVRPVVVPTSKIRTERYLGR